MNDKKEKTIEIPLSKFEELLEIKGRYEELKNKKDNIVYIPYRIYETPKQEPYKYPSGTWGIGTTNLKNTTTSCSGNCSTKCGKHEQN